MSGSREAGFTLLELMMSMAMGVVVIAMGFALLSEADASQRATAAATQRILDRHAAVERMRLDVMRVVPYHCDPRIKIIRNIKYGSDKVYNAYGNGAVEYSHVDNFMLDHDSKPNTAVKVSLTGVLDTFWSELLPGQVIAQSARTSPLQTTLVQGLKPAEIAIYCLGDTGHLFPMTGQSTTGYGHNPLEPSGYHGPCHFSFTSLDSCRGVDICLMPRAASDPAGGKSLFRADRPTNTKARTNPIEVLDEVPQMYVTKNPHQPGLEQFQIVRIEIAGDQYLLRTGMQ